MNNGRKITDFFHPSQNSSGSRRSSDSKIGASSSRDAQRREEAPALRKSSRLSRATSKGESLVGASPKRTRSPDVVSWRSKSTASSGYRSKLAKRLKKFESDSDMDMTDPAIIYVKPAPRRGNATFNKNGDNDRFESIPTSQADEMELDVTDSIRRSPQETKRCQELPQERCNVSAMQDFDASMSSSPLPSLPSTPNSLLSAHSNGMDTGYPRLTPDTLTPPISEHLPALVPSPVALDEKTKTAQLIEKIKAQAQAKVQLLQDSPIPQFNESLDSSSDEEEMLFFPVPLATKGSSEPILTRSINDEDRAFGEMTKAREPSPSERSRPYALRRRKSRTNTPTSLSPSARGSPPPNMNTTSGKKTQGKTEKVNSTKSCNPLDTLLSEKRKLEKVGRDAQAFLQAQSTVNCKESLQQDNLDSDDTLAKWLDESAAQNVIQEVLAKDQADCEESNLMDVTLDAEEAVKLIGANGGKMADILKHDHISEEDTHTSSAHGLRLWATLRHCSGEPLPNGHQNHPFQYCGANPVVGLLKVALDQQDYVQASLILESGVLPNTDLSDCNNLLSSLCEQAFSCPLCPIKLPAFRALSSIYTKPDNNVPFFVVTWLLHTFATLGAEPSVLEQMGYHLRSVNENIGADCRADSVQRLIHVIQLAAQSQRVEANDIPDIIIAILRIALDPSTCHDLRMDITRLVNTLCNAASPEVERRICEKAISFSATLELPLRAQFVSAFSYGSGLSRHIARWIAYSALTNQAFSQYVPPAVPPLQRLLYTMETGNTFRVKGDSDYAMLWHQVRILDIVLTDIGLYNAAESRVVRAKGEQATQLGSLNKRKDKHTLILIHEALERLHSEIQDTRALHLDRSRVKAAIKQLSLRLQYQYSNSANEHGLGTGMPRRKTLEHFFSPKKSQ